MEDYKKMYLEQKRQALMLEMSLMQMRAGIVEKELPKIEAELREYDSKSKKSDTVEA
jgi:septation ring formation regulator EzrA